MLLASPHMAIETDLHFDLISLQLISTLQRGKVLKYRFKSDLGALQRKL